MPNHHAFLKVNQDQIQNPRRGSHFLHGVGLGGWMNMENFITGFPANENAFRQVVYRALGKEKADFFFDRYLEYFFTDEDARLYPFLGPEPGPSCRSITAILKMIWTRWSSANPV